MKGLGSYCGIDIAKQVISIHIENSNRQVICRKNLTRSKVLTFFSNLPACLIGIESCGGSQYWARELMKLGHDVRLMNARFIVPYRRKSKNDANDAEAICEAVTRPHMRFVSIKSEQQQSILMMHRLREQCVSQRRALINQMHGFLLEFGISLPKGAKAVHRNMQAILDEEKLPSLAVEMLHNQMVALAQVEERESVLTKRITQWAESNEQAKALLALEGVGPLTASAIVATAGSAKPFKNGRQFAAWLGLVPKQRSSGGKAKLGGITKTGDSYLRKLLVQSARSVLLMANRGRGRNKEWVGQLVERRPTNVVAIAMAAKQARMAWAVMAGKVV
ncbi:MAG: IS110 family transposase [Saccharospirillum sp.]|uniref:IS110 family transposase n=1 Tax=Saccharospirillum sp. TaxID=2033801 RepID=UPI003299DDDB